MWYLFPAGSGRWVLLAGLGGREPMEEDYDCLIMRLPIGLFVYTCINKKVYYLLREENSLN